MVCAIATSSTLAFRGIIRRPARSLLLLITLVISVATWLALAAMASRFVGSEVANDIGETGVNVSNARAAQGSVMSIPRSYVASIEALQGVRALRYIDALPVVCRPPSVVVTLNGIGGSALRQLLDHNHVAPSVEAQWDADRLGVLVGAKQAALCGWRAGMTVSPKSPVDTSVEIHVIGIINGADDGIAIAHYAYINSLSSLAGEGRVLSVTVYPDDKRYANVLAAHIEAAFSAADPPVVAHASATVQAALGRFGKVQELLALVSLAMFLCTLLVFVSVLAHAAIERHREMAIMHVLGFTRMALLHAFGLEFTLIVLAGTVLGSGVGLGIIGIVGGASPFITSVFGQFEAPWWAWQLLSVGLVALLGTALIAPSLTVARLRPIDYQRD